MFNLHNSSQIYYVNETYGKIFPLQSFCASWERSPYIIFFPSRDQGQKGKHFWLQWLPHSYHIYRKYIFLHYHDFKQKHLLGIGMRFYYNNILSIFCFYNTFPKNLFLRPRYHSEQLTLEFMKTKYIWENVKMTYKISESKLISFPYFV